MSELSLKFREDVEGVVCEDVTEGELEEMVKFGEEMIQFCVAVGGAGLSAPQVGLLKKIIIWPSKPGMYQIGFNPRYYKDGKKINSIEGCLSYPAELDENNIPKEFESYFLPRWKYITGVYYVPNEERTALIQISRKMRKEEAIVYQHETDHINGQTIRTKGKLIGTTKKNDE